MERGPSGATGFAVLGDNALSRENEDFYIPDRVTRLSAHPQLVLRVGKLGKAIAPRFASRYVTAIGVAVRLRAENLLDDAARQGLPPDLAVAFDHAVAISSLHPLATLPVDARYTLALDGRPRCTSTLADLPLPIPDQLALLSTHCLLKVGDLIFCGNTAPRLPLFPGTRVTLTLHPPFSLPPLDFSIR
jgi:2-keto-4-pentenoate hydratase/2-oxohepta-3-ene-1,7-dioic acid hydratase in catechol pathway